MTEDQIQQEIAIIKKMIEKTRRETADSGHFLITVGIFTILAVFAIGMLNFYHLGHLALPVLIIMVCGSGIIGYFTVARSEMKAKVKSYPKTICYSVWAACAIPALLVTFLFPFLHVYPGFLAGVFSSLILGIAVFSTGIIFESPFVVYASFVWWAGAIVMAFVTDIPQMFIMIPVIFFGWVVPGIILNRRYKNRSTENEA